MPSQVLSFSLVTCWLVTRVVTPPLCAPMRGSEACLWADCLGLRLAARSLGLIATATASRSLHTSPARRRFGCVFSSGGWQA
ncbi:hypothetical protein BC834DRAFT_46351 [Gloeopeniophorella convolvens]|nr:hypothetical protein BC834DRAFT_46351 [Gloeopeniophorella convolvens]